MGDESISPEIGAIAEEIINSMKASPLQEGIQVDIEEDGLEEEARRFDENLAEFLPDSELSSISSELLDGIENDIESRKEWESTYVKGISYLGLKLEDFKNVPFMQACRAFDTTLSNALLRFYSTGRAELFPQKGPVNTEVLGNTNPHLDEQAEKVKKWFNYYLTDVDKEYYPDSERLLMYLGLVGCSFRKIYMDPVFNRPIARFIDPQNFIVNNDCVTILSSDRLTHVLHLNKTEIKMRQKAGFYRDIDLPDKDSYEEESPTSKKVRNIEGISLDQYETRSLHKLYEVHANLDIEDSDDEDRIPHPYIVTICPESRKVLSIRRNWEEGDIYFKRKEYFVQYNYLPGFGIYGLGLANLLGTNSIALTSILRQLIDAGTLKNFPGGLTVSGLRIEENDKAIGPGEFRQIETGGLPIQQAVMPLPYSEPSPTLLELKNQLMMQTEKLGSIAETQVAETNPAAPVGTTLALLEVNNKIQSSVFRSLHMSLTYELQLLYNLFRGDFPEEGFTFDIPEETINLSRQDFSSNFRIIPTSDPSISTSAQRIIKSESILRIASGAPQLHDMREVYKIVYESFRVEDIDKILPPPKEAIPLDPITENMNAIEGKPLRAAMWQDHQAHMMVHSQLAQDNPILQSHMAEHQSMEYLKNMQMQMGMMMPPLDQLQNPEIQNQLAMHAAQAVQARQQQQEEQQQQQQPIDPNEMMMADIAQRREAAMLKEKEAKMKAETEAFKAQLHFESEKSKMENQKEIADSKNQTALELQQLKDKDVHHDE